MFALGCFETFFYVLGVFMDVLGRSETFWDILWCFETLCCVFDRFGTFKVVFLDILGVFF